jgi:hypothetical protein
MRRFVFVILIVLAFTAAGSPARATSEGLAIRQRINVSGMQRPDREQTLYYTPAVRITDDVRTTSIIDLDRRTVTFIDKQAKTYSVTTFDELAARDDRHDDRVRELPPQVRDMVESGDPVKITPTGRTLEVAGQATREYKVESRGMTAPSGSPRSWISATGPRSGCVSASSSAAPSRREGSSIGRWRSAKGSFSAARSASIPCLSWSSRPSK